MVGWVVVPFVSGGERMTQRPEDHHRRATDVQMPLSQVVV
jgi:hypothetical protein